MDITTMALIYGIGGAILFSLSLKMFSVEHNVLHAIAACCVSGLSVWLIPNGGGAISLVIQIVVFKMMSKHDYSDFIPPVFVSRLALVPVLLYFDLNVV